MIAILKRELHSYFHSATAYMVMAFFYFFAGVFFSASCLYSNSSSMRYVFSDMFMIILLVVPIITMKSFSEEKRQKTDQALLTSPLGLFEIVIGKFLGALVLYTCCVAIFLLDVLIISFFTTPDWSSILCTVLGLYLFGAALIAIDIFISALSESQVVSAVVSVAVGLFIYMLDSIGEFFNSTFVTSIINAISFNKNYLGFTIGVISLSSVVFFLSVIAIFVFLTVRVLEKKRWA